MKVSTSWEIFILHNATKSIVFYYIWLAIVSTGGNIRITQHMLLCLCWIYRDIFTDIVVFNLSLDDGFERRWLLCGRSQ